MFNKKLIEARCKDIVLGMVFSQSLNKNGENKICYFKLNESLDDDILKDSIGNSIKRIKSKASLEYRKKIVKYLTDYDYINNVTVNPLDIPYNAIYEISNIGEITVISGKGFEKKIIDRRNTIFKYIFACFIAFSTIFFPMYYDNHKKTNLQEQLTTLEEQATTLQNEVDSLKSKKPLNFYLFK